MDSSGIVTPEAVLLDMEPAGLASRFLSAMIDLIVLGLLSNVTSLVVALFAAAGSESLSIAAALVIGFLILFGYPVLCEWLWHGRTVGKAALGLRVVTLEGGPLTFGQALIRTALRLIDVYLTLGLLGGVVVLFSRRHQRLGDLAAGTVVLRERSSLGRAARSVTFIPPAGWEPYASTLDVPVLRPAQYGLVRSFLLRVNELDRVERHRLSTVLAAKVAAEIGHTPPPNTDPELFLVAVASAYQRRSRPLGLAPTLAPPPPAYRPG